MGLQPQVGEPQVGIGAGGREHLGHEGLDGRVPGRAGHRDPVVAVADEVGLAHLVERDGLHGLAPLDGRGQAHPPLPGLPDRGRNRRSNGPRLAVDRPDDGVEANRPEPDRALAHPAQGGHHLVERQDGLHVAGLPAQPPGQAGTDLSAAGPVEGAGGIGFGMSGGNPAHHTTSTARLPPGTMRRERGGLDMKCHWWSAVVIGRGRGTARGVRRRQRRRRGRRP